MSAAGVTQPVGGSGCGVLQESQPRSEQDFSHEQAAPHLPRCYWGALQHPTDVLGGLLHKGPHNFPFEGMVLPQGEQKTPSPAFQIWVSPLLTVPGWSLKGCHISAVPPEQSHVWNLNIRIMGLDNLASLKVCKYCI